MSDAAGPYSEYVPKEIQLFIEPIELGAQLSAVDYANEPAVVNCEQFLAFF